MTEAIISSFIGISLLVWLVGMLTGWFDQNLLSHLFVESDVLDL